MPMLWVYGHCKNVHSYSVVVFIIRQNLTSKVYPLTVRVQGNDLISSERSEPPFGDGSHHFLFNEFDDMPRGTFLRRWKPKLRRGIGFRICRR